MTWPLIKIEEAAIFLISKLMRSIFGFSLDDQKKHLHAIRTLLSDMHIERKLRYLIFQRHVFLLRDWVLQFS